MQRLRAAMCILTLSFVVLGCGSRPDHDTGDTEAPATENVFQPYVGAIDRAHAVQDLTDQHGDALDAALAGD